MTTLRSRARAQSQKDVDAGEDAHVVDASSEVEIVDVGENFDSNELVTVVAVASP